YFWVGAESVELPDGGVVSAGTQMYVEEFVPAERRHEHPIVFVHGGGGQGIAFMGRGDGHPGWLHYALAEGYAVYLPDRPGHGRNPPHPQLVGPMDEPTPYTAVTPQFKVGAAGGRRPGTRGVRAPGRAA